MIHNHLLLFVIIMAMIILFTYKPKKKSDSKKPLESLKSVVNDIIDEVDHPDPELTMFTDQGDYYANFIMDRFSIQCASTFDGKVLIHIYYNLYLVVRLVYHTDESFIKEVKSERLLSTFIKDYVGITQVKYEGNLFSEIPEQAERYRKSIGQ